MTRQELSLQGRRWSQWSEREEPGRECGREWFRDAKGTRGRPLERSSAAWHPEGSLVDLTVDEQEPHPSRGGGWAAAPFRPHPLCFYIVAAFSELSP